MAPPPRRPPLFAGLLLSLAGVLGAVLLVEIALRAAHFEFHVMPTVQFGWPDPQAIQTRYMADPDLFWVTRDYQQKLAAARETHPDVIFIGDSCTEFGTYPQRTMEQLSAFHAPVSGGIHLATGGWSSEQGVTQVRRDVVPLHPKVLVVYYGWNDHWIALGPTDHQLTVIRRWIWLSEHLRILQVALKARIGVARTNAERPNRVPPDEYLGNLEEIATLSKSARIVPVFVTAPSNHIAGHEPQYLLLRHVRQLSELVPLHQQYVSLTRRAASDSGSVLCDAAAEVASLPTPKDRLFRGDGIHFTPEGDRTLASIVSACIVEALGRVTSRSR
jgi:lysophospholipase L1-like esterase